jgi:hypothetical protein
MPTSSRRIALITGGSRGLGQNTVLSLAKRGVDSIFTYHSNQAEAERVVRLVAEAGRKAIALQLDTGNVGAFDPFAKGVRKALADLDAERFDYHRPHDRLAPCRGQSLGQRPAHRGIGRHVHLKVAEGAGVKYVRKFAQRSNRRMLQNPFEGR